MKTLKKFMAGLLIVLAAGFGLPRVAFCSDSQLFAKAENKRITQHEPKIKSLPEKEMEKVASEEGKKTSTSKYLLIGLGALLVIGGVAALAGGGGGGDGGGGGGGDSINPGSISLGW